MRRASRIPETTQESSIYIDDLTGIHNRHYLEITKKEIETFQEKNIPFSVVIVDIDHFKEVNDTHGHLKGDEVIREFAQFIKSSLRGMDTVVRYGGDEFVCVMANCEQPEARQICNRILERCKRQKFGGLEIMISAGVASYPGDGEEFEELLKLADESLYDAKRTGRGQIGGMRKKRIELPTKSYVGRKNETKVLEQYITASNGAVRVAIIEGTVGIGKTRLVKEVLNNIRTREILWGDCLAFSASVPYYPIIEIIKYKISRQGKKIIEKIPLAYRIELGKLIPEIMDEIKEPVDQGGLVLDKYRLYESVMKTIATGGSEKIIVIDNMQWADKETIEILKYLLRSSHDNPMIFMFIFRQEEKTEVLEDFTLSISRYTTVKKLGLESLKQDDVKMMVKLIIDEDPEKELAEYVAQGSGGNPFYIEEIIKGLNEVGYLNLDGDKWQFDTTALFRDRAGIQIIPRSIEDIIERKYRSLSNEGKEILEIASAIGWFDINMISVITGYNEGHIIGVLEKLKRLGLIKEGVDRVEFRDELSRNTIYQSKVIGAKARILHKKVAELLEEQYKGKERSVIEELALHYYRAMDKERGVRYSMQAGELAREKYAHSSAVIFYSWAHELLKDEINIENIKIRIDCLLKRADILSTTGDIDAALKDLEDGLEEAETIKDKKIETFIRYKKAIVFNNISQYQKAIEEATRCMKIYVELGDKEGIAGVSQTIGSAYWGLGDYEKSLKINKDSLKISRDISDQDIEAKVLGNIGNIYANSGDFSKALKYFEAGLKMAKKLGNKHSQTSPLNNIGNIYGSLGDYNKALKYWEDSLKIAREVGSKHSESLTLCNIGVALSHLGDYNRALEYSENSLRIARNIENKYGEALALNLMASIYIKWGDYNRALNYLDDALQIFRNSGNRYGESGVLVNIGIIHNYRGKYTLAMKDLQDSLRIAETISSNEQVFTALLALANLYLARHETKKTKITIDRINKIAREAGSKVMFGAVLLLLCDFYLNENKLKKFNSTIKKLQDLFREIKSKRSEGDINLLLGRYSTEIKDFKKATKHLNEALKIFERLKEQLTIGGVYYYLGMMELKRGSKSAFHMHLKESLKIFNSLGAQGWIEKVKKALKTHH